MLTLKVITTDLDGNPTSHLFSGDSIIHKEYFSDDHCIVSKVQSNNDSTWIVGSLMETSSTQKFIVSEVQIYDEDRTNKNQLFIVPKADCYIMHEGKTIDSFFCFFDKI